MQAWSAPVVNRLPAAPAPLQVQAFDTASRQVVPLARPGGTARMYVCGITPYDATHIGHANTYVTFDLLNRIWRDTGSVVEYVQNVTDVDDPLLERARDTGVDWQDLAARADRSSTRADMAALNVLPPEHFVGAVESIGLVTEAIATLQERGAIYAVDDPDYPDLYFSPSHRRRIRVVVAAGRRRGARGLRRTRRGPRPAGQEGPARLPGLAPAAAGGARLGLPARPRPPRLAHRVHGHGAGSARPGLRRPGRRPRPDLPAPRDVCGRGPGGHRPGRSRRCTCTAAWSGLDGEKMSKSRGNLVFVSKLRESGVDPMAIRLALLSHHYREDWMWTDDELDHARDRLDRWREAVRLDAGLTPTRCWSRSGRHWPTTWTPRPRSRRWTPGPVPPPRSTATTPTPRAWWPGSATACWASGSTERCSTAELRGAVARGQRYICYDELTHSRVFRGRCNSEPAVTVRDPMATSHRLMW